jgi:prevent-host-death family protein
VSDFSTTDLSRRSGDIIAEALRRPVSISQRGKPRLVLLSIEDFRRLTAARNTRKVHTLASMPDDLFAEAERALAEYEGDGGQP